jgi:hypothetical protein
MEQNKHIFDEEDENKLEYTLIFERYVYIVDEILSAQLKM